ncbi:MAG: hypothetical protein H7A01_12415 [Hahellaceae bacterium]|jgi:hypothetical protein|nr:hypothetical protein [Hahellaceae bacterium]MCP5209878.1 hypothetical protein [Hahellaceae bacterium]
MLFDSNHVIATLEKMYQLRVVRLSDKACSAGSLKALVLAAELEALDAAIKSRTLSH